MCLQLFEANVECYWFDNISSTGLRLWHRNDCRRDGCGVVLPCDWIVGGDSTCNIRFDAWILDRGYFILLSVDNATSARCLAYCQLHARNIASNLRPFCPSLQGQPTSQSPQPFYVCHLESLEWRLGRLQDPQQIREKMKHLISYSLLFIIIA